MVIICGATPHSLLITTEDMKGKMGLKYKANPPIRPPETVYKLRKSLERIDFIESDHAPHSPEEKFANGYLSGYTSYEIYSPLIEALSSLGLTEKRIEDMTYNNAKKFFPKIKE
jgi:dihydroorotase-like cyclic amidohydrolase